MRGPIVVRGTEGKALRTVPRAELFGICGLYREGRNVWGLTEGVHGMLVARIHGRRDFARSVAEALQVALPWDSLPADREAARAWAKGRGDEVCAVVRQKVPSANAVITLSGLRVDEVTR